MKEVEIAMLGPSRVGKTSLLASMYHGFAENIYETDLRLHAEPETAARLYDRWCELASLPASVEREPGIISTTASARYAFEVGARGRDFSLRVTFHDYPGDYLRKNNGRVMDYLKRCCAVLIAIDTPALMESRGEWASLHERHNAPRLVADMMREAYRSLVGPRLVLLAPTRCERYLRTPEDAARLVERVKQGYRPVLEALSDKEEVAVALTPVQTVGSVGFSRLGAAGDPLKAPAADDYAFYFERIGERAVFAPRDTEQPLRHLLRFLLTDHLKERRKGGIGDMLDKFGRDLLGIDFWNTWIGELVEEIEGNAPFRRAIQTFAAGSKRECPFETIQGAALLG